MGKIEAIGWQGFININKPAGITSFMAVRKLKRLQKGLKIGHLGTLDPMAEGVLPLALGGATRLIPYISDRSKKYSAEAVLGAVSDTQDIWGQVEYLDCPAAAISQVEEAAAEFRGNISQVPPMFSAVHHQGQRLYQLARQGQEVERAPRNVKIYDLKVTGCRPDPQSGRPVISLEVHCSEGTYIRTLCHDIGQRLGCGAVMSRLVRTAWGSFELGQSVELEHLVSGELAVEEVLLPPDYPLQELAVVGISDEAELERLYNGNPLPYEGEPGEGNFLIRDEIRGRLAALAKTRQINARDWLQPVVVLKPE